MKTYRVVIEPDARDDMLRAFEWMLAQGARESAVQWLSGLEEVIMTLRSMPERCPLAPENEEFDEEIRELLYLRPGSTTVCSLRPTEETRFTCFMYGMEQWISCARMRSSKKSE